MKVNINEFRKKCECGVHHEISVKDILIETGAISRLPQMLKEFFGEKSLIITMISDDNTFLAGGMEVLKYVECNVIQLSSENLHANNHGVDLALKSFPEDTTVLLAVGAGTIHDITRYIAYKKDIPFISIPTAASVDGFVSTVAAMTWDGYKTTLPAVAPMGVIADTAIFSNAPYRLSASGISDLLGKYTAIVDWKVSHLVTGEYICNYVCQLELEAVKQVKECIADLRNPSDDSKRIHAYEQLMYALILSGMAMQMVGNSRPASGAEHHVSHLWEMEVINEHVNYYHGEKVSVGLVLAVEAYEKLKEAIKDNRYTFYEYEGLETQLLEDTFGKKGLYEMVLEENKKDPLCGISIQHLSSVMPQIAEILDTLPSHKELLQLLTEASCIKDMSEVGLSEELIPLTLRLSPYVRNRLTVMRLLKLIKINKM